MSKVVTFIREFLKNLSIISTGALFIHVIVTFFDLHMYNNNLPFSFDALFYAYKVPVIVSYGILTLMLYTLYSKLQETKKALENERKANEENAEKVAQLNDLAAYVLQTVSHNNNNLRDWVETRRRAGSVPQRVDHAVTHIGSSLELLSRAFFLIPYSPEPVDIVTTENPTTFEQKKELKRLSS